MTDPIISRANRRAGAYALADEIEARRRFAVPCTDKDTRAAIGASIVARAGQEAARATETWNMIESLFAR